VPGQVNPADTGISQHRYQQHRYQPTQVTGEKDMAVWIPLLKASLPYVTQIVATAIPVFTSKPGPASQSDEVVAQQIAELQSAATQNAESIQILAEKLQRTIEGIDAAAMSLQKELRFYRRIMFGSLVVSVIAIVTVLWALL
jgi:hypothetical protein